MFAWLCVHEWCVYVRTQAGSGSPTMAAAIQDFQRSESDRLNEVKGHLEIALLEKHFLRKSPRKLAHTNIHQQSTLLDTALFEQVYTLGIALQICSVVGCIDQMFVGSLSVHVGEKLFKLVSLSHKPPCLPQRDFLYPESPSSVPREKPLNCAMVKQSL